jgi:hypothetical protein
MNKFDKIRNFCRPFRIVLCITLIIVAFISGNAWFYLGVLPLIAGIANFCPTCIISKQYTPKNLDTKV